MPLFLFLGELSRSIFNEQRIPSHILVFDIGFKLSSSISIINLFSAEQGVFSTIIHDLELYVTIDILSLSSKLRSIVYAEDIVNDKTDIP